MKSLTLMFSALCFFLLSTNLQAEDGYKLWLRYAPITDQDRYEAVKSIMDQMIVSGSSSTSKVIRDELCLKYDQGVKTVSQMKASWTRLENQVDHERFEQVQALLDIQESEAAWWRNACLLYFQQFSQRPFPSEIVQPEGDLESYPKTDISLCTWNQAELVILLLYS